MADITINVTDVVKSNNVKTFSNKTMSYTQNSITVHTSGVVNLSTQLALKADLISPSFTTPALGTPSSGNLSNCTGVPITGITGYLGVVMSAPVAIFSAPADSATYYAGAHNLTMTTTQGNRRVYFTKAMTIKYIGLEYLITGVLGTTEAITVNARLNQTTDTLISSAVTWDALNVYFSNNALSLAVVAGDYIEFKHATPPWLTNPTNINFSWYIYGE